MKVLQLIHFCGDSHCMWHTAVTVFACRAPACILNTVELFEIAICYAASMQSMHAARLVVCLLFVCVGCVLCLLKGSLRRTPLWSNNHGNCSEKIPFLSASVVYLYTILFYSFISVHSLPCEGFVWFLLSCLGFKYLLCAALGYT